MQDKTVTVKFRLQGTDKYILAWTTTPWTLPANLGLAVGVDIEYSEVRDTSTDEHYILASDRLQSYYKTQDGYTLIRTFLGSELVGKEYAPILPGILEEHEDDIVYGPNAYTVIPGHHVNTDSGTGIVHIAPAYGEDDSVLGKEHNLGHIITVDDVGHMMHL